MAGEGKQGVLFVDAGREDFDARQAREKEIQYELFVRPEIIRAAKKQAQEAREAALRILEDQIFLETMLGSHVLSVSII